MTPISQLIAAARAGDARAATDIFPIVYDELRRMATRRLASESSGHVLQPTALVHEAYLRLVGPTDDVQWQTRGHFFAAAARAMRQILLDHARRKNRVKRGSGRRQVELDPAHRIIHLDPVREMILDEAITRLGLEDPGAAGVAALHVFAGMTIEEVADCTSVSRSTAYQQWSFARAWLGAALRESEDDLPNR